MKLALHSYWRSSASYRVRIALGVKGLAYEYVAVDILRGGADGKGGQHDAAYRAMNPMAQVPTLVIGVDDGTARQLVQSLAIMEYVDERWPEPPLLPASAEDHAQARALAEIVNAGIQPLQNITVLKRVKALGGDDKAWIVDFVTAGLAAFDAQVASSAGRYCVGDRPSIADCCLVPQQGPRSAGIIGTRDARDSWQRHLDHLPGADDLAQSAPHHRIPDRRDPVAAQRH